MADDWRNVSYNWGKAAQVKKSKIFVTMGKKIWKLISSSSYLEVVVGLGIVAMS